MCIRDRSTRASFAKLNAVTSGVADVREVLKEAENRLKLYGQPTYLLLDECHRWSKAQSDSILPAIEQGTIRFIGSTTEDVYKRQVGGHGSFDARRGRTDESRCAGSTGGGLTIQRLAGTGYILLRRYAFARTHGGA